MAVHWGDFGHFEVEIGPGISGKFVDVELIGVVCGMELATEEKHLVLDEDCGVPSPWAGVLQLGIFVGLDEIPREGRVGEG